MKKLIAAAALVAATAAFANTGSSSTASTASSAQTEGQVAPQDQAVSTTETEEQIAKAKAEAAK